MVFNPSLEQKQGGDYDEQQSHGGLDEIVDAGAMDLAQVHQKTHAEIRAGNAADGERQTTFMRTVPLRKWMMLAGILVKKLHMASLPTAMMAGRAGQRSAWAAAIRRRPDPSTRSAFPR